MASRQVTKTRRPLAGAAAILMASFIASRVAGVGRDMAISYEFGTSPELASYLAAFRLPDLLFQLVAGAALASAFIPTFARCQASGGDEEAWNLTSQLLNLIGIGTFSLSLVAIAAAPWLVPVFVSGFDPAHQELTVHLTRIMLATPVLFGVSAILGSALNARQHFLLPAVAPIIYNLAITAGALFLSPVIGIDGLAWGVVGGSLAHLLVQVAGVCRQGMVYRLVASLSSPGVREVGRLMGPRVLGLASVQVNFLVTTALASRLASYSIPALNYAWMVTLLPVGAFGVAISSAVFPTLAARAAQGSGESMAQTVYSTMRLILFLTIPASAGLMVLGQPLIALLFQRGLFDEQSAQATYLAVVFYSSGLFGHGMVEILTRAFYASRDTRTPVAIGIGSMALSIALSLALMGPLGHGGLALSVALAAAVEGIVLYRVAKGRLVRQGDPELGRSLLRTCLATAIMGLAVLALRLSIQMPSGTAWLALYVAAGIAAGSIIYFASSYALGSQEARLIWRWRP